MQPKLSKKELLILNAISEVLKELRIDSMKSQRTLAFDYGLHKSLISRLESASNNPFFLSVWKAAEATEIKPSKFVAMVEEKLPAGFKLLD